MLYFQYLNYIHVFNTSELLRDFSENSHTKGMYICTEKSGLCTMLDS